MSSTRNSSIQIGRRTYQLLPDAGHATADMTDGSPYSARPSAIKSVLTYDRLKDTGSLDVSMGDIMTFCQSRVFILSALGLNKVQIAELLNNSVDTVKTHRREALRSLDAANVAEATSNAFSKKIFSVTQTMESLYPLTGRESDVLIEGAILDNLSMNALMLDVGRETLKTHRKHMYEKLGVVSMSGAIIMGHVYGLIDNDMVREVRNAHTQPDYLFDSLAAPLPPEQELVAA